MVNPTRLRRVKGVCVFRLSYLFSAVLLIVCVRVYVGWEWRGGAKGNKTVLLNSVLSSNELTVFLNWCQ